MPTLRVTAKSGSIIEIYRTPANQTTFYKVTSDTSPTFNSTTADTVTFTDTLADSSITSNEIVYNQGSNQGGPLSYGPPPAGSIVCTANGRLFVAGLEDPLMFAFSHTNNLPGHGIEFNDAFRTRIDIDNFQAITAMASLDDKIIFFSRNQICYIYGDGPDRNGNGQFSKPTVIPSSVGCIEPRSVVVIPAGVMFQSAQGIYLLTRDLSTVQYIGAGVEAYNNLTITGAQRVPSAKQVIFTTSDSGGRALVFDYSYPSQNAVEPAQGIGNWTTFTNCQGIDSVIWNNKYTYMRTNGDVFVQNANSYKDDNQVIPLLIQTAWLNFDGIQGYQQVKRVSFLAQYYTTHSLVVNVGYDYQPAYTANYVFPTANVISTSVWGDGTYWGTTSPWGGVANGVYQLQMHLRTQKCQSIQFQFYDSGISGASYSLSDLALEIGILGKINRAPTIYQK